MDKSPFRFASEAERTDPMQRARRLQWFIQNSSTAIFAEKEIVQTAIENGLIDSASLLKPDLYNPRFSEEVENEWVPSWYGKIVERAENESLVVLLFEIGDVLPDQTAMMYILYHAKERCYHGTSDKLPDNVKVIIAVPSQEQAEKIENREMKMIMSYCVRI